MYERSIYSVSGKSEGLYLRGSSNFRGSGQTQEQQIQDQAIVLGHKGGKLQATDDAVAVGVCHVLVCNDDVVLGRHVVCNVVVKNQTQQPVEESEVHLHRRRDFRKLFQSRFHVLYPF